VRTGHPVLLQAYVDRLLSAPQRLEVSPIRSEPRRRVSPLGNGPVPRDHDVDVPDSLLEPIEPRLIGIQLTGSTRVEHRDQYVGQHVAGEQDTAIREEYGGMSDSMPFMLDELARDRSAIRRQRTDQRDQLNRDVLRSLHRHSLRLFSSLSRNPRAPSSRVPRHIPKPRMPQQMIKMRMRREPSNHRNPEPLHIISKPTQLGPANPRIDENQPVLPAYHSGITPNPPTLPYPNPITHLLQHPPNLSGIPIRRERRAPSNSASGPACVPDTNLRQLFGIIGW
jgi:hypothetical protein